MAIPEHNKCVKIRKRIRYKHRYGTWRTVRRLRRKLNKMKPRERIRTKMKAEMMLGRAKLLKVIGVSSYTEASKIMLGPRYRKWGKYDE